MPSGWVKASIAFCVRCCNPKKCRDENDSPACGSYKGEDTANIHTWRFWESYSQVIVCIKAQEVIYFERQGKGVYLWGRQKGFIPVLLGDRCRGKKGESSFHDVIVTTLNRIILFMGVGQERQWWMLVVVKWVCRGRNLPPQSDWINLILQLKNRSTCLKCKKGTSNIWFWIEWKQP